MAPSSSRYLRSDLQSKPRCHQQSVSGASATPNIPPKTLDEAPASASPVQKAPAAVPPTTWVDSSGTLHLQDKQAGGQLAPIDLTLMLDDLRSDWQAGRTFSWAPSTPDQDPTFPRDDATRTMYVFQLLNGMVDTSRALDARSTRTHFVDYWQKPASEGNLHYDVHDMGRVCWDLLQAMSNLHRHGLSSVPCYDESQFEHPKMGKDMDFQTRVDTMADLLSISKHKCEDMMKGATKELTVLRCKIMRDQAIENHKNNPKRSVVYQEGKQVEGEAKMTGSSVAEEESNRSKSSTAKQGQVNKNESTQVKKPRTKEASITAASPGPSAVSDVSGSRAPTSAHNSLLVDSEFFQSFPYIGNDNGFAGSQHVPQYLPDPYDGNESSTRSRLSDTPYYPPSGENHDWNTIEEPMPSVLEAGLFGADYWASQAYGYDSNLLSAPMPVQSAPVLHHDVDSYFATSDPSAHLMAAIQGSNGNFRLNHGGYSPEQVSETIEKFNDYDDATQTDDKDIPDPTPSRPSSPQTREASGAVHESASPRTTTTHPSPPKRKRSSPTHEKDAAPPSPTKRPRVGERSITAADDDLFNSLAQGNDYVSQPTTTPTTSTVQTASTTQSQYTSTAQSGIINQSAPADRSVSPSKRKRSADSETEEELSPSLLKHARSEPPAERSRTVASRRRTRSFSSVDRTLIHY